MMMTPRIIAIAIAVAIFNFDVLVSQHTTQRNHAVVPLLSHHSYLSQLTTYTYSTHVYASP